MAILEREVWVGLSNSNVSTFESIGYKVPRYIDSQGREKVKIGTKILVKVEDLQNGSQIKVTKICDACGEMNIQSLQSIIKSRQIQGSDQCKKCAHSVNAIRRKNNPKYIKSLEFYAKSEGKGYLLDDLSVKNKRHPSTISKSSKEEYIWNCKECNSEYVASVGSRTNMNSGCPYCSGKRVNSTNCLTIANPILALEWHPSKNKPLTTDDVTVGANKLAWWLCPDCKSEYECIIYSRGCAGTNCPYCNHMKINHTNCLSTTHPNLSKEWDFERNKIITPSSITKGSEKDVWWICPNCQSSYLSNVYNRTCSNNGCPYCAGKRVNHTNCLETTHPELTKEWNYKLNKKSSPKTVTYGSTKKVWWICSDESCGFEWEVSPNQRTGKNTGCSKCSSSKGIKYIINYFKNNNVLFELEKKFQDCKNIRELPFDFSISVKQNTLLIEYDGKQHFEPYGYFGGLNKLKQTQKHDKIKNEYCYNNNLILYRISYIDLDNIETIIENIFALHNERDIDINSECFKYLKPYEFWKTKNNPEYYERVLNT